MKPVARKSYFFHTKRLLIKRLALNNHAGPNKACIKCKMLNTSNHTDLKYVVQSGKFH